MYVHPGFLVQVSYCLSVTIVAVPDAAHVLAGLNESKWSSKLMEYRYIRQRTVQAVFYSSINQFVVCADLIVKGSVNSNRFFTKL